MKVTTNLGKNMKIATSLILTILLSACSSMKTQFDYDPSVNFNHYKTFAWVETKKMETAAYHLDGLMDKRVKSAINDNLTMQGFKQVAKDKADVLVNYLTKVDKKINVDTFNTQYGYYPYYGRFHTMPVASPQTIVNEYKIGTLIIDLVDQKSGHLVWRGSVEKILDTNNTDTPEQRSQKINEAVNKVFTNYPPNTK